MGREVEWTSILKELFRQIDEGSINLQHLQAFLEHRHPFEKVDYIKDWKNFYKEVFGIDVDLSNVKIPIKKREFNRLIIVAQGMTPQKLFNKCKELFPCEKWTNENLDKIVSSERNSENGAYAVWFRYRVEADEELKNLSANDLKARGIFGITLEERLLFELKHFKETGKHLDIKNVTLCAGSHWLDGIPHVSWYNDRLFVSWGYPDERDPHIRSRQAALLTLRSA